MSSDEMTAADTDEPQKPHDPEDYITERRLRDIYDARQQLLDTRRQAAKLEIEADTRSRSAKYKTSAVKLHRSAIENYLLELQPLFANFNGVDLWHEQYYGTITVAPPRQNITEAPYRVAGDLYQTEHNGRSVTIEAPLPKPVTIDINGFNTLFTNPSPMTWGFEFDVYDSLHNETITKTSTFYIKKRILDRMLTAANDFLAKHGLELDPDDTNKVAKFDYSDIS